MIEDSDVPNGSGRAASSGSQHKSHYGLFEYNTKSTG